MVSFVVRRILGMLPVFIGVAFVSFGIVSLAPGDFYTPQKLAAAMAGASREEAIQSTEAMRIERGIDKPWIVQFYIWLEGVITEGDFGVSFASNGSVTKYIFANGSELLWTMVITGSSLVLAWLVGIPIGIISGVRRGKFLDIAFSLVTYGLISMPGYVLGWCFIWAIYHFVNPLIIAPGVWGLLDLHYIGQPLSFAKVLNYLWHLWPAWIIVGAPMFAMVVRLLRLSIVDTLSDQYIVTARGKGLSERPVLFKHALRNAINPLVSMFGMMLPTLITGSILATQVLGLPTFGKLFLNAVRSQDQHVITAALLFYSLFLVGGNLIADILLAIIDPRIRYQ